jgi:hypothetical protein
VGLGVGAGVGDAVGWSVGDTVGSAVGCRVGDKVGLAVGAFVGLVVGAAVGDIVLHVLVALMQWPLVQSESRLHACPGRQRLQPVLSPPQSTSVSPPDCLLSAQSWGVGDGVGARVGEEVGRAVGAGVGVLVGDAVGEGVGLAVGACVGSNCASDLSASILAHGTEPSRLNSLMMSGWSQFSAFRKAFDSPPKLYSLPSKGLSMKKSGT